MLVCMSFQLSYENLGIKILRSEGFELTTNASTIFFSRHSTTWLQQHFDHCFIIYCTPYAHANYFSTKPTRSDARVKKYFS